VLSTFGFHSRIPRMFLISGCGTAGGGGVGGGLTTAAGAAHAVRIIATTITAIKTRRERMFLEFIY
jgi:hypothetical protein